MAFNSTIFLFIFLPVLFTTYICTPPKLKNLVLLIFSIIFYMWGDTKLIYVILTSILFNYISALLIEKYKYNKQVSKLLVSLSIIINLAPLIIYKYTNFFIININRVDSILGIEKIKLLKIIMPIGISYFTFQAISYIVDVYKEKSKAQRNLLDLALYISFFPRLIAGPIIRYPDIEKQLFDRKTSVENTYLALKRFIVGLGKKVIIANTLGTVVDKIFAINQQNLTFTLAWLGIICYTLQIYFDFSGYSDMAISLAKLFGFDFKENFNYPYISKSITEFWRRWHISLSSWFRDYLYIPLGGNRVSKFRNYINLLIVFICTGIWHGSSWNFIFWGLFHGFFIVFEKFTDLKISKVKVINRVYTILVVTIGWVFFKSDTLKHSLIYLKAMVGMGNGSGTLYYANLYINNKVIFIIAIAIIGSTPIIRLLSEKFKNNVGYKIFTDLCTVGILGLCIMMLINSTSNPFIYFRF